MAVKVGDLYSVLRLDSAAYDRGIDRAGQRLEGLGSRAGKVGKILTRTFAAVGVAAAAGLGFSIKSAADFEQALSNVKSVMDPKDVDKYGASLKGLALQLGKDTKYSATEAAKGMEELVKAGVATEAIMKGGLKAALDLATAGDLELADAAEIASTALNAFKADNLSVADAANILAGAANASATSVGELKYGLAASAAVASAIGMSFNDTSTALAVFAQNGLKGSDAGTSLKTMLMNLVPQSKAQTAEMLRLGLMTEKGANAFFDSAGHVKSLAEISEILRTKMAKLTDEQRLAAMQTLFGSDAIRAANILYKEGAKGVTDMNKAMSAITAAEVAAEKMNNFYGALENLSGAVETLMILIGDPFLGPLKKLAERLDAVVSRLAEDIQKKGLQQALIDLIPPGVQDAIKTMSDGLNQLKGLIESGDWEGLGKALGEGLNAMLKNLGGFGKKLVDMFMKTISEIDWAAFGKKAVGFMLGFVLGVIDGLLDPMTWFNLIKDNWQTILWIVVGIIAAPEAWIGKLVLALRKVPIIGPFLGWLLSALKTLGMKIAGPIINVFKDMGKFFMDGLGQGVRLGNFFPALTQVFTRAIGKVKDFGASIYVRAGDAMIGLGKAVRKGFDVVMGAVKWLFGMVEKGIMAYMKFWYNIGKFIVEGIWKGISGASKWLYGKVKDFAGTVADTVKNFFGIHSPSRLMATYGMYVAQGLAKGIAENSAIVKQKAEAMAEVVKAKTKKAKDAALKNVAELAAQIKPKAQLMADAIIAAAEAMKTSLGTNLDITKAKMDLLAFSMGKGVVSDAKTLRAELLNLNEQLKTQKELVAVAAKRYYDLRAAKGATAQETKEAYLAFVQEQVAQKNLEKQIADTNAQMKAQIQSIKDLKQQLVDVQKQYKNDLAAAAEEYHQKVIEANKQLEASEKQLTDTYQQQLESRAASLRDFVGLFDEVSQKQDVTGQQLLDNLQGQVVTFQKWQQDINGLEARGIDAALLKELRDMGPKAGAEIAALLTLTDQQLAQYVGLWKQRSAEATAQATVEMEPQRQELARGIEALRAEAAKQLEGYKKEWETKNAEIRANLKTTLDKIGEDLKAMTKNMPGYGAAIVKALKSGFESELAGLLAVVDQIQKATEAAAAGKPAPKAPTTTTKPATPAPNKGGGSGGGGVNPTIPGMATGGQVLGEGLSWVGEKGPELRYMPRGAQIIPLKRLGPLTGLQKSLEGIIGRLGTQTATAAAGGPSIQVNVYDNNFRDGTDAGNKIYDALRRLGV